MWYGIKSRKSVNMWNAETIKTSEANLCKTIMSNNTKSNFEMLKIFNFIKCATKEIGIMIVIVIAPREQCTRRTLFREQYIESGVSMRFQRVPNYYFFFDKNQTQSLGCIIRHRWISKRCTYNTTMCSGRNYRAALNWTLDPSTAQDQ
jgi:hypothetical protein